MFVIMIKYVSVSHLWYRVHGRVLCAGQGRHVVVCLCGCSDDTVLRITSVAEIAQILQFGVSEWQLRGRGHRHGFEEITLHPSVFLFDHYGRLVVTSVRVQEIRKVWTRLQVLIVYFDTL